MDFPATGGAVSSRGHGGHRELAFHVPNGGAYAPQCMALPYDQLSNSSAGIAPYIRLR